MTGEPITLLLVEDETAHAKLIERAMARSDLNITLSHVHSGAEAHLALQNSPFDLVLLDYSLPGQDGLDLLPNIVETGSAVIMITAKGSEKVAVEAMKLGALDCVVKSPETFNLLPSIIERSLKAIQAEEALRKAHDELEKTVKALESEIDVRERAQEQLVRSEKLAAVGRLTAGVSHEVLNPLNIITLSLQLMIKDRETPPEIVEQLRVLEDQADRIAKITQELLYFSRQREPERRWLDLGEIVTQTLGLLERELTLDNIELELKLAEELPPVSADEHQLQQVVLNLLTNAKDAMPKGGRLTLSTDLVQTDGQQFVELRVEDTGAGIAPEHLDKLFDPFFTTKGEGEGTGLGLSIGQGIVDSHGGSIRAENVPGGGAAFIVRLAVYS
ncbi:MAG: response regulator [Nitrospinae bacterium]|nr:response regulator [Nitrospinota bacterium]